MPCFYLNPKQDSVNQTPELQVCIAEALYDIESVLSNPGALTKEEIRVLRDQIGSNLEQAWEITGGTEDQLLNAASLHGAQKPGGVGRIVAVILERIADRFPDVQAGGEVHHRVE